MKDAAPLEQNTEISRQLRSYYEAVQEEDIPSKFLDLLEQLDKVEAAGGRDDDNGR